MTLLAVSITSSGGESPMLIGDTKLELSKMNIKSKQKQIINNITLNEITVLKNVLLSFVPQLVIM